jgi:hypothetical protein
LAEEIKIDDEVRLSHSSLAYKVICFVDEKVWIKDITGIVGNTIVDKRYLTKAVKGTKE